MSKKYLRKSNPRVIRVAWWLIYLFLAPWSRFKSDYVAAWSRRGGKRICMVFGEEIVEIPLTAMENDEAVMKNLRMFYRMMVTGLGFSGLLLPKELERINCVEVDLPLLFARIHAHPRYL